MANRRIGGAGGGSDPGPGKAGVFVTAAVLAGAVAGGGALGGAGGGAADSVASQNLNARKSDSRNSARKGNADEAWQRMNMRTLKKTSRQHLECVTHSFGQVREFFVRNPCRSLDRVLFGVGDEHGNVVVISVAWVGFRSRADAREFRNLNDVHGTGDISPLASGLLDMADIAFTGHHYGSRPDGTTIVIAEAETASGHVEAEVLDALAEVAAQLPRP